MVDHDQPHGRHHQTPEIEFSPCPENVKFHERGEKSQYETKGTSPPLAWQENETESEQHETESEHTESEKPTEANNLPENVSFNGTETPSPPLI